MKKDDMLEITIEDISSDGSGVGKQMDLHFLSKTRSRAIR